MLLARPAVAVLQARALAIFSKLQICKFQALHIDIDTLVLAKMRGSSDPATSDPGCTPTTSEVVCTPCSTQATGPPIVLVPGFLSPPSFIYWDLERLRQRFPEQRFIAVSPGPLSSHHDRACEIFAQIKGGRVDFGEAHAREHGHSRFGRRYEGLCPEWDAEHPIHLVGHSIGGVTCRVLQEWLAHGFFCAEGSADWVLSITALSSPLNGDPVVHRLGASVERPGEVAFLSCGWWLTTFCHLLGFFDVSMPLLDLQLEHWELSRRHGLSAVRRLLLALLWQRSIGQGEDNAASELSFHSMLRLNRQLSTHARSFYFSFAADMWREEQPAAATGRAASARRRATPCLCDGQQWPASEASSIGQRLLTRLCRCGGGLVSAAGSACVGAFAAVVRGSGKLKGWRGSGFKEEEWRASDGLLSVRTQRHPLNQPWRPMGSAADGAVVDVAPGVWNVQVLPGADHLELAGMGRYRSTRMSQHFWDAHVAQLQGLAPVQHQESA